MCQRFRKPSHHAVADHPLMDEIVGETRAFATEQAKHIVRVPAGMSHRLSAEGGKARHLVSISTGSRHRMFDFVGELFTDTFVGIQRQHPIAGGQRQSVVLLRTKTAPLRDDRRPAPLSLRLELRCHRRLPPSTTMRSSQNATLSRHASILRASFLVMTMAERRGMALVILHRATVPMPKPDPVAQPAPCIPKHTERKRQIIFPGDLPAAKETHRGARHRRVAHTSR